MLPTECDTTDHTAGESEESVGKSFSSATSAMVAAEKLSDSECTVGCKPVVDGVTIRIPENSYDMCELTVVGNAFLWHQIRCIVAVLLLIGEEKESPEVSELMSLYNLFFSKFLLIVVVE